MAESAGGGSVLTTDSVVDSLRDDILGGVFAPGERLVELQLTDRYQCGRAIVRAALVQLESEGLVEKQANRGAVVRRVSIAEAIEITEARAALEALIAGRAARLASDADKEALQSIVVEMREAVELDDAPGYAALNRRLHSALRDIGHHSVANQMVENLRNRAVQNQYRLAMMPGRQAVSVEQHADIVDAVVAGDEEAAAAAMSDHLGSVIGVLRSWGDAQ